MLHVDLFIESLLFSFLAVRFVSPPMVTKYLNEELSYSKMAFQRRRKKKLCNAGEGRVINVTVWWELGICCNGYF